MFTQHPSTVFLQDQPGQQRRERQFSNKASNERRRTKYAAERAIPNSPMAISSFSSFVQAQRPENSMAAVKWLVK